MKVSQEFKVTYHVYTDENKYHSKDVESGIYQTAEQAVESVQRKQDCFGFILHTRKTISFEGDMFYSEWHVCRKVYFGKIYTLEQIENMFPHDYSFIMLGGIFGGAILTPKMWIMNDPDYEIVQP